jgi:hypothetical protein
MVFVFGARAGVGGDRILSREKRKLGESQGHGAGEIHLRSRNMSPLSR